MPSRIIMLLAALMLTGSFAMADCHGRNTTQAERDLEIKTRNAIKEALPAAPHGWKISAARAAEPTGYTCTGVGWPVPFEFKVSYERVELTPRMKELKEANAKRAAERSKRSKEYKNGPEYAQDDKRQQELGKLVTAAARRAAEAAMQKNEKERTIAMAELDKLQKESFAIGDKRGKFFSVIVEEEFRDQDEERKDTSANVEIFVNGWEYTVKEKAQPFSPTGALMAFMTEKPHLNNRLSLIDTTVSLLYGNWNSKNETDGARVIEGSAGKGNAPKINHILIQVTANDKDRASELAKGINHNAIKASVSR